MDQSVNNVGEVGHPLDRASRPTLSGRSAVVICSISMMFNFRDRARARPRAFFLASERQKCQELEPRAGDHRTSFHTVHSLF